MMHQDFDAQSSASGDSETLGSGEKNSNDEALTPKAAQLKLLRRQRDAERHRKLYSNETEEQRKRRRERDALRHRLAYQQKLQRKRMLEEASAAPKLQISTSQDVADDSEISDDTDYSSNRKGLRGLRINTSSAATSPVPQPGSLSGPSPTRRGGLGSGKRSTAAKSKSAGSTGRGRSKVRSTRSGGAASSTSPTPPAVALAALSATVTAASSAGADMPVGAVEVPPMLVETHPSVSFDTVATSTTAPSYAQHESDEYNPEDLGALDSFFTFNPSISISFDCLEPEGDCTFDAAGQVTALMAPVPVIPTTAAPAVMGSTQHTAAGLGIALTHAQASVSAEPSPLPVVSYTSVHSAGSVFNFFGPDEEPEDFTLFSDPSFEGLESGSPPKRPPHHK